MEKEKKKERHIGEQIIAFFLFVGSLFFWFNGFMASEMATTIMHQLYGMLNFIVGSILLVGACLLSGLKK